MEVTALIGHVLHFDYASMRKMGVGLLMEYYTKAVEILNAQRETLATLQGQ